MFVEWINGRINPDLCWTLINIQQGTKCQIFRSLPMVFSVTLIFFVSTHTLWNLDFGCIVCLMPVGIISVHLEPDAHYQPKDSWWAPPGGRSPNCRHSTFQDSNMPIMVSLANSPPFLWWKLFLWLIILWLQGHCYMKKENMLTTGALRREIWVISPFKSSDSVLRHLKTASCTGCMSLAQSHCIVLLKPNKRMVVLCMMS